MRRHRLRGRLRDRHGRARRHHCRTSVRTDRTVGERPVAGCGRRVRELLSELEDRTLNKAMYIDLMSHRRRIHRGTADPPRTRGRVLQCRFSVAKSSLMLMDQRERDGGQVMSDATDRIESDELRRQLARAWEAGCSAGWTDQLCRLPTTRRRQSIQGGIHEMDTQDHQADAHDSGVPLHLSWRSPSSNTAKGGGDGDEEIHRTRHPPMARTRIHSRRNPPDPAAMRATDEITAIIHNHSTENGARRR